jgi:secondary thiamine-phosphate synthase enzyme
MDEQVASKRPTATSAPLKSAAMVKRLTISTTGQGLHEITDSVVALVEQASVSEGLCTVFIQHTSASLVIQENANPSARHDLEQWLNRLVKEDDPLYTHTAEGPDDMPSHIKAILTASSLSIPILNSKLALGRWQGIYLWEHRHHVHERHIVVHIAD